MIKATELRIGNLILLPNGEIGMIDGIDKLGLGTQISAVGIYEEGYKYGEANHVIYEERANPIPLTEEWLLKFGFEQSDAEIDYMEWDKYPVKISNDGGLNNYKNEPFYFSRDEYWDKKIELKYVHQLQNLYFALTGEELKWS